MTQPFRRFHHLAVLSVLMASAGLVMSGCGNRTSPTPTPVAPTITSFTAAQPSIAPGSATVLNWQVSGSTPLTLSLDNGIGTVSGSSYNVSPAATTTYTLTATNSTGQVSKSLTVTVSAPVNQAPTVTSPIGNKNVNQGAAAQTVDLKSIFNDLEDGSAGLSFSVNSSNLAVAGPSIAGSTLTLNFGNPGTAQVTVTAKDSGNLSANTSFSVTVASNGTPPTNQAPVVTNPIAGKTVNAGAAAQTVDLKTVFADAEDGTNLTFTASSNNPSVANASVAGSTLNLTFGSTGSAMVSVTAKDSGNLSISTNFSVTVSSSTPINQAPTVVSPIANKSVSSGAVAQSLDLKTVFNDVEDGTNLTFTASSSNASVANASVAGSTLNLTFGSTGTAQVTVTAKDSGNLTVSSNFSVTVASGGGSNQTPTVVSPIANKTVTSGAAAQSVNLKTVFNDAEDGTNLTFTASSNNAGVANASVSGSTLNLTFGSVGTAQVTVTAKDSGNLTVSSNFSVTVASGGGGNQAPTVVSPIANKTVSSGAAAQTVDLKTVFTDAEDGTNLTFTASSSNNAVVSTSVVSGTLNLTFGSMGTAQLTATAKDSGNLSVSTSFSVTVGSGGGTSCISGNFMNVQPYNASLPDPTLTVTCTSTKASVATNAIPNHQTGAFPNSGNPHSISAQNRTYPLTLSPTKAASITQQTLTLMGVAVNGIGFEPFANEYYNNDSSSGWRYEALAYPLLGTGKNLGIDSSNAHVQPTGNYHYHGLPNGLVTLLNKGTNMTLIGYIGDGFPVYAVYGYNTASDASSGTKELSTSYRLKSGTRPSGPGGTYDGTFVQDYEYVSGLGDLDECNGRFGVTPEYPSGIYHYYITKKYPFIPRCFVGTPESYYVSAPK